MAEVHLSLARKLRRGDSRDRGVISSLAGRPHPRRENNSIFYHRGATGRQPVTVERGLAHSDRARPARSRTPAAALRRGRRHRSAAVRQGWGRGRPRPARGPWRTRPRPPCIIAPGFAWATPARPGPTASRPARHGGGQKQSSSPFGLLPSSPSLSHHNCTAPPRPRAESAQIHLGVGS